jgi:hypothetical protein
MHHFLPPTSTRSVDIYLVYGLYAMHHLPTRHVDISLVYGLYMMHLLPPTSTRFVDISYVYRLYMMRHILVLGYTNRISGAKSEKCDGRTDTKLPVRNTFSEFFFRKLQKNRKFSGIPIGISN